MLQMSDMFIDKERGGEDYVNTNGSEGFSRNTRNILRKGRKINDATLQPDSESSLAPVKII